MRNPIHVAVLIWMGINIVENLDLEELAATVRQAEPVLESLREGWNAANKLSQASSARG